MNQTEPRIHLASRSPRRQSLLAQIGVGFTLLETHADETRPAGERPEDYVCRVALEKALAGRAALSPDDARPVLAADTAVVIGERVLGKPLGPQDAAQMMRLLSGRTHRVFTAVALISSSGECTALSESRVTFRALDEEEILRYWRTGEPADKAGGYGIQGYGALFVERLEGSYSGVMGLPLFETGRLLEQAGVEVLPAEHRRERTAAKNAPGEDRS